jgi:hypothetical protein
MLEKKESEEVFKHQTRRKKPGLENYSAGLAGFFGALGLAAAGLAGAALGLAAGLRLGVGAVAGASGSGGVGSAAFLAVLAFGAGF